MSQEFDETPGRANDENDTARIPSPSPTGEVYDWYHRGLRLLDSGNPAAAALVLSRAAEAEPASRSIREALARSQFDAAMYADALDSFRRIAQSCPDDDYAHFGWGLSAARLGDFALASRHLALAAAMRPDIDHYARELRSARATLRAREAAGG